MSLSLRPRHVRRYVDIARVFWRHRGALGITFAARPPGLDDGEREDLAPDGPAAMSAELEALGPTFVKLGQMLSTRPDLIAEPYARGLARLQDRLEPVPLADVERVVLEELGVRISKAFSRFDPKPLASASLGQVHRAALRDGRPAAVKVQRPGITQRVAEDMEVLQDLARFIERRTEAGRLWRFGEIVDEAKWSLAAELDYRAEAANLERLAEELRGFPRIVVPLPIADYTRARVLTMDYVRGRKVTELGPLARLELDGAALVDELLGAYLEQILVHGFFHADPHPGNVFVTSGGELALLDLGMVARVPPGTREILLKLVLALSEGRRDEAADQALALGEDLPRADEAELRRSVSQLISRGEQRTGRLVLDLSAAMTRAGFGIPRELALLGKTLLQLDQICRTLSPGFDPNLAIRRRATSLIASCLRRDLTQGHLLSGLLEAKEFTERLPRRVNRILDAVAEDRLTVRVQAIDDMRWVEGLQKIANRITAGLVLAALIVGGALLMRADTSFRLFGQPGFALLCLLAAAGLGGMLLLQVFRRDERPPR